MANGSKQPNQAELLKGATGFQEQMEKSLEASLQNASVYAYDYRRGHYAGERAALLKVYNLFNQHFPALRSDTFSNRISS